MTQPRSSISAAERLYSHVCVSYISCECGLVLGLGHTSAGAIILQGPSNSHVTSPETADVRQKHFKVTHRRQPIWRSTSKNFPLSRTKFAVYGGVLQKKIHVTRDACSERPKFRAVLSSHAHIKRRTFPTTTVRCAEHFCCSSFSY